MPRGFQQMYAVRLLLLVTGVAFIVAVPPIGVVAFGIWLAMHRAERGRRQSLKRQEEAARAADEELAFAHWILWKGRG